MPDEYLDVVDENNLVIGQEKRAVVHQSGLLHRGVHIFLFTPDDKMIVQMRSEKQDFPGAMDCSVSEHLNAGESYYDGAIRGLQEELGIGQISLTRRLQFKMHYTANDYMVSELYEGICDEQDLTIDHHEVTQIAYYSLPELEEMMVSYKIEFTPWFVQLLRWYVGKLTTFQVVDMPEVFNNQQPSNDSNTDSVREEESYEEANNLDDDYQDTEIHSEGSEEAVQKVEALFQQESGFFQVLKRTVLPTLEDRREKAMVRLAEFDDAIEAYPKAAANYVYRGEIYLKLGQMELAADDFGLALELATVEFEKRNWGIVAQTIRDRAQQGLKRAQKHLV